MDEGKLPAVTTFLLFARRCNQISVPYVQGMVLMNQERDNIILLRKGAHNALAKIMSQYQDYVYHILKAMLSHDEAQEATQDTFIKIYKSIGQYREGAKFSTWLYSIAYRTGLDYLRKRQRHAPLEEASHHGSIDGGTMEALDQSDLKIWLNSEIDKLKPEDAVLIRLYYLQEQNIKEVATTTGLSTGNIKVKLFRIRKTLKAQMSHMRLSDIID